MWDKVREGIIHVVGGEMLLQLLRDRRFDGKLRVNVTRWKRQRRRRARRVKRGARRGAITTRPVGHLMMTLQIALTQLLPLKILLLFLRLGDKLQRRIPKCILAAGSRTRGADWCQSRRWNRRSRGRDARTSRMTFFEKNFLLVNPDDIWTSVKFRRLRKSKIKDVKWRDGEKKNVLGRKTKPRKIIESGTNIKIRKRLFSKDLITSLISS